MFCIKCAAFVSSLQHSGMGFSRFFAKHSTALPNLLTYRKSVSVKHRRTLPGKRLCHVVEPLICCRTRIHAISTLVLWIRLSICYAATLRIQTQKPSKCEPSFLLIFVFQQFNSALSCILPYLWAPEFQSTVSGWYRQACSSPWNRVVGTLAITPGPTMVDSNGFCLNAWTPNVEPHMPWVCCNLSLKNKILYCQGWARPDSFIEWTIDHLVIHV